MTDAFGLVADVDEYLVVVDRNRAVAGLTTPLEKGCRGAFVIRNWGRSAVDSSRRPIGASTIFEFRLVGGGVRVVVEGHGLSAG